MSVENAHDHVLFNPMPVDCRTLQEGNFLLFLAVIVEGGINGLEVSACHSHISWACIIESVAHYEKNKKSGMYTSRELEILDQAPVVIKSYYDD